MSRINFRQKKLDFFFLFLIDFWCIHTLCTRRVFMKKFIWVVSCLFFAVHGWAANNIKMVSYFPIPYASYSDLKVEGVCDLGLLGKCELKAGSLTVDSADPTQTAKMQVNSGTLKLDPAVGVTPKIAADFLHAGNVEDFSTASWFNVEDYLSISHKFLDQDKIKGLSATEATLRQVALRGKDGAFLNIPSCAATDNEINWKNLTIDGRQGVYLICGNGPMEQSCEENPNQKKCCAYSKTADSITYWKGGKCNTLTCPTNQILDSHCGINNVTPDNLENGNCDLSCYNPYKYVWTNKGTESIVGVYQTSGTCAWDPCYYSAGGSLTAYATPSVCPGTSEVHCEVGSAGGYCSSDSIEGRVCTKGSERCYEGGFEANGGNGNGTRTFYYYDVMACECEEPGKCN